MHTESCLCLLNISICFCMLTDKVCFLLNIWTLNYFFRAYIDARLRVTTDALQQLQQLVLESKKRFNMFYSCVKSVQMLTSAFNDNETFFSGILHDETLRKVVHSSSPFFPHIGSDLKLSPFFSHIGSDLKLSCVLIYYHPQILAKGR